MRRVELQLLVTPTLTAHIVMPLFGSGSPLESNSSDQTGRHWSRLCATFLVLVEQDSPIASSTRSTEKKTIGYINHRRSNQRWSSLVGSGSICTNGEALHEIARFELIACLHCFLLSLEAAKLKVVEGSFLPTDTLYHSRVCAGLCES